VLSGGRHHGNTVLPVGRPHTVPTDSVRTATIPRFRPPGSRAPCRPPC